MFKSLQRRLETKIKEDRINVAEETNKKRTTRNTGKEGGEKNLQWVQEEKLCWGFSWKHSVGGSGRDILQGVLYETLVGESEGETLKGVLEETLCRGL